MKPSLYSLRSLVFCCASSTLLLAALDVHAATSQSPLSLTIGVPPNLILTLDDSGSMDRAYVPDSIPGGSSTRRYKSAHYNPMYYNPKTLYKIPPKFNLDGSAGTALDTAFTAARLNGFNASKGTIDLSTGFRPASTYDVSQTTQSNANNPTPEFYLNTNKTLALSNGQTSSLISENSVSYRVKRVSNSSCTVTVEAPLNYPPISCSRSGSSSNTHTLNITDKRTSGVPAYYYVFDDSLANCPADVDARQADDNCYRKVDVSSTSGNGVAGADERKNFAIWYSFYRTRSLATISAASIAFADLASSTRLTWQGLTTCTSLNSASDCLGNDNKFREYNNAQRGKLFNWMQSMSFPGNTPLRAALDRAGKFLKNNASPAWDKFPNESGNDATNKYACRPSYHILMTDGVWNSDNGSPANSVTDTSSFDLPDGVNYSGTRKPYTDSTNNTLADIAFHYWATDLNSSLSNTLKPYYKDKSGTNTENYWNPQNNPATWQNMANFTIGLGLTASLNQDGLAWEKEKGSFASEGYKNISSGTKTWPAAASGSNNNVYDLWHAAINSRGDFFSADSPETVVQAFADIMSRIADRKSTAAKPAINSGQVAIDENDPDNPQLVTSSYQTSYASDENWSGDLKRTNKTWKEVPLGSGNLELSVSEEWSAKSKLPAASARNIKIKSTGSSGLQPLAWVASDVSTAGTLANLLSKDPENGNVADSKGEARLNYLRGDRSLEGGEFRTRSSVLGDFLGSSPSVVAGPRYLLGIANRLEPTATTGSYTAFATSIQARKTRVYAGANDGMLHGFNAKTGVEEFAFIPSAVFPKLNKLTGKNYSHEFYVDGAPVVADVYDGTKWRTILVGTLRAGGKSIFALDITDPGNEKLLWEFDDSNITTAGAVKMGFSFSQPTIARLHNGRWAVVFGNGYEAADNTNGKAALFIIDAIDGTLERSLEVSGTPSVANGLSSPRLADNNGDGVADYAYAGDLQGNLWRFDLLSSGRSDDNLLARLATEVRGSSSQYKVAYNDRPMFSAVASDVAETPQPITAAPILIRHPSGAGHLVIFATGKYFEDTDKDGNKSIAQSVYGIWDEKSRGEKNATGTLSISRSNLVTQTIGSEVTATDSANKTTDARIISQNPIPWDEKKGWKLDLKQGSTLDGEMVIEPMVNVGQTIYFQSLVPNNDPCADGASNWTYGINAFTGGKTPYNAFDMQQVKPDNTTAIVSAIKQDGEGGLSVTDGPGGLEVCTGQGCEKIKTPPNINARNSWRRIEETE